MTHRLLPSLGPTYGNPNGLLHANGSGSPSLPATVYRLPSGARHLCEAGSLHLCPLRTTVHHQASPLHDLLVDLRNDHQESALHNLLLDLRDDHQEGSLHNLLLDL